MCDLTKSDVFPRDVVRVLGRKDELPLCSDFKVCLDKSIDKIIPFIIYTDRRSKIVYYHPIPMNEKAKKHFRDTVCNITTERSCKLSWGSIAKRITKPVNSLKKNSDVRTCFKYDLNFFITKPAFTFGQRTVMPGTNHVYQIGVVELMLFILPKNTRAEKREKLFKVDDQFQYNQVRLSPNKNYLIPENTTYVVCTIDRCYFAVHIIEKGIPLPFTTIDPTPKRVPKLPRYDIYKKPVQTPMIECVVTIDSDDETEEEVTDAPEKATTPAPRFPEATKPHAESAALKYSDLMPPPPPPRPAPSLPPPEERSQPTITLVKQYFAPNIPLERKIQVVQPDVVAWYRRMKYFTYGDPKANFVAFECEDPDEKALDLTTSETSLSHESKSSPVIPESPTPAPTSVQPIPERDRPHPESPRPEPESPQLQAVSPNIGRFQHDALQSSPASSQSVPASLPNCTDTQLPQSPFYPVQSPFYQYLQAQPASFQSQTFQAQPVQSQTASYQSHEQALTLHFQPVQLQNAVETPGSNAQSEMQQLFQASNFLQMSPPDWMFEQ